MLWVSPTLIRTEGTWPLSGPRPDSTITPWLRMPRPLLPKFELAMATQRMTLTWGTWPQPGLKAWRRQMMRRPATTEEPEHARGMASWTVNRRWVTWSKPGVKLLRRLMMRRATTWHPCQASLAMPTRPPASPPQLVRRTETVTLKNPRGTWQRYGAV